MSSQTCLLVKRFLSLQFYLCFIIFRIKSDLENRYSEEITLFLNVCILLDPLTQESNTSIIEAIKQTVMDETEQVGQPTTSPAPSTEEEGCNEPPNKQNCLGEGDQQSQANAFLESLPQHVEKELEQYLHYPLQDVEPSPLQWWQLQHHQFSLLAKLARKYLCVCATSPRWKGTNLRVFNWLNYAVFA